MKALVDLAVRTLSCALLAVAANGCWTADAHDHAIDAGSTNASALCALAPSPCFATVQLSAPPVLVDLAHSDATGGVTLNLTSPNGVEMGGGFNPFPQPDVDAGNFNGINRVLTDDPDYPYHLKGTVPASAGWNINWYYNADTPDTLCTDPFNTKKSPIIDASNYDGISIQVFGNVGPTGKMVLTIDSVGTPQDPTRQQELQTTIYIPNSFTPTTYNFNWSDLTAMCGSASDFQPGRIIGFAGQILALAGVAYDIDLVIGAIAFIPKSQ